MTVSADDTFVSYEGNDSTYEFAFTFKIFEEADIAVMVTDDDGIEHVLPYDTYSYEVSGELGTFESGGLVTLKEDTGEALEDWSLPSGWLVTIYLDMDYAQTIDLGYGGTFKLSTIERMVDRVVKMVQQLASLAQTLGGTCSDAGAWGTPTEVTLADGVAIAPSPNGGYLSLDTEGDTAEDDLIQISGLSEGSIVILRIENNARVITAKNWAGMKLDGGNDFVLDSVYDRLVLQCHSTGVCVELSRKSGGN